MNIHSRRIFLRQALGAAAYMGALGPLAAFQSRRASAAGPASFPFDETTFARQSPLSRRTEFNAGADFNGDEIDRPHEILWNKDSYLRERGGVPKPDFKTGVVVVGGGIAGLMAADRLRRFEPILLEQASRVGGNSKGEIAGRAAYSIGAAYVTTPDEGSPVESFLRDLGVHAREERIDDASVCLNGQFKSPFWSGATDPARASEFERVARALKRVRDEAFPEIPHRGSSAMSFADLVKLDSLTFEQWVKQTLGAIHPHIEEFFHQYCWSSFAGEYDEISAAQALNFLTSDLGGVLAIPGGNAAIAEAIYRRLRPGSVQTGAFVVDISPIEGGVRICYEDAARKLRSIDARACIVASPKVVAKMLIANLPKEQEYAMSRLHYRAYLVANVSLKARVRSPSYELFCLKNAIPTRPRSDIEERGFTDLTFAGWADHDGADTSVLTLYKAMPYEGARQFLFSPGAHDKHKRRFEATLPEVLHALGLRPDAIAGLRLTRWGHSLPVARAGLIGSGYLAAASQTLGGRIFFANQDNWASPCFESALEAAVSAAASVRKALG